MSRVSRAPGKKVEEDHSIDETVAEFLRARQERIRQRRFRISDKIANKKKTDERDTGSIASSLEFLMGENKSAGSGGESGSKGDSSSKDKKSKKQNNQGDGSSQDVKKSTVDSLDVQIEESRKQLEQIILDGESLVTNVRIAAECREKNRHIKQSENRKERLDRLRQESTECQELYENLKPNWDLKGEKILPLDLHSKIKAQQNACDDLLQKKQDLIISLQREIEENDFDYETNLEMYQKDVSLLGDRIDDGVDDLQSAFLNELNLIEDYTCRNREVLLEENQREWMDLLEDFETMEEGHLEDRKKDALNKFQILNEMYITVKQECRAMRHKFEDDLRILIQELEQIKYATQLNMEKLQYNLAIIRKRFKENVEMKNMMKRLLLKFNDRFTTKSRQLKAKMESGRKEAKKILNDIEKLEESLQNFGRKTLHLVVSDYNKYMDLWIISEEIVRERLQKLLDSEKFIFETQLGIESPMPELLFMDERPDVVTKYMRKKGASYTELVSQSSAKEEKKKQKSSTMTLTLETDGEDDTLFDETALLKTEREVGKPTSCQPNASLVLLASESIEFIPGPEPDPVIQRRLMKHVAKVICDESGFIVEDELRRLLEPLKETERNLVNLDALLKALGIKTVSEMQYLAHFLLKRCRVTKGIISRIGSQDSAHLTEMNVSLDGILGKNAMDDLESLSGSMSTKSKTPSPIMTAMNDNIMSDEDELTGDSLEFKECECSGGDGEEEDLETGGLPLEVLHPPQEQRKSSGKDDDCICLIPELEDFDNQKTSLPDFTHQPVQCSPKCCSPEESEEDLIGEVIVTVEDDQELEEMLEAGEDEEAEEAHSKCSTCGGEPHDHQDCSFISNAATVLSWADPGDPPNQQLKELQQKLQEEALAETEPVVDQRISVYVPKVESPSLQPSEVAFIDESFVSIIKSMIPNDYRDSEASIEFEGSEYALSKKDASIEVRTSIPHQEARASETKPTEPEDDVEILGEPVRIFDEIMQPDNSRKSSSAVAVPQEEDEDEIETVSILSLDSSSNGSEEFMYIEPAEVIDALTEFCKDYNAKITVY
ncbi:unnamed protein product [Orchesella dallaii]|uniref:Dynein regulatory complex protein 1/2 N-terminal domain-containing protein n=1 Tax=Orchesella dallaii TaxID=48710 RepID=A0ABP1QYN3_9HEXA